ncbi:CRISPR-associated endonuclease Cas1 [Marinomonas sp.]|uniref:CRISPR-associated endonuclease Cas1 n=1 Tax=Marinomonas sp. TaxID=1904862 RepID=UPI003BA9B57E
MHDSPLTQAILPLRSVVVTLRWLYNSQPGFLHHVGLHAWLRNLAGSPEHFSDCIIIEPLENGHSHYHKDDLYRFRLVVIKGGGALLQTLFDALQKLPESVPAKARNNGPFGDNLILEKLEDSFDHQQVTQVEHLSAYDTNDLALETALWARTPVFKFVFTTPARLKAAKTNPSDNEQLKGKQRYCRDKHQLSWELLTQRLTDTLINLYQRYSGERLQRQDWPAATLHSALVFWLNNDYQSSEKQSNQQQNNKGHGKKDASGMLAQLQVELPDDFPADLLALIVLGQYIGIGQNRAFGMGLYQLEDAYGIASYPRPQAANTLMQQCMSDAELLAACQEMYPRREDFEQHETDEEHQLAIDSLFQQLQNSRQKILQGNYQPSPLQPVEIDKPDGGIRQLSVPSWHDRTLQKTVTERLGQTLESLWMKHSYGYRKGHSRLQARDQINRYIQQGYHWILESDISSFFDSVNWLNLQQRLTLLFPNEPLVPLIMQWVCAAKQDTDDTVITRHQGLPQGAPISPLLANLLLDDLDQDMLEKGHNIIRYADDFVLLFKTQSEAIAALDDIHRSLSEHGLAINPDKTRIVESKQGFRYLGYFFIDGYAIESNREIIKEQPTEHPLPAVMQKPQPKPDNTIGERDNMGTILIIAGDIAMLSHQKQRLIVEQYEQTHSYPWQSISAVLLVGAHHITTPALKAAMQAGVAIHFANGFGHYQGVSAGLSPSHLGADFWLLQAQYLQQQDVALQISQALIHGRIAGIKAVINRRDKTAPELNKLQRFAEKLNQANDLDQLRGYEGQASKLLWSFFKRYLAEEWGFTGRNRRPPKDPINAMLSLGYSFLYSLIDSINRTVGLFPWQGALHQRHGNHHTLASDLMEPWRYLVERVVLTLVSRSQIKPEDFADTENGCQMSSAARKTLLNELLIQLTRPSKQQEDNLLNQIRNQSYRFALSCKTQQRFDPWSPTK